MADRKVLNILDSSVKEFNRFVVENSQDNEYFDLTNYKFTDKDFREISFGRINFKGSTFRDCRMDAGFINGCLIEEVKFYDCSLVDIYWHLNEINSVLFSNCDLSSSSFECVNFSNVFFRNSNLRRVKFSDVYSVKRLILDDCNLRDTLIDLDLVGTKEVRILSSVLKKLVFLTRISGRSKSDSNPDRPEIF